LLPPLACLVELGRDFGVFGPHGGIGVTDEHDVGLYFKRMQALGALYGDEEHHVARYARLPSFTAGIASSAA